MSPMMNKLQTKLRLIKYIPDLFEHARNKLRTCLHAENPINFPYGKKGLNIQSLAYKMLLNHESNAVTDSNCDKCGWTFRNASDYYPPVIERTTSSQFPTTWLKHALTRTSRHICQQCGEGRITFITVWKVMPVMICFAANQAIPRCNREIHIRSGYQITKYELKEIIYLRDFHFNARLIDSEGFVWFHDRINTGRKLIKENHIDAMSENLGNCRGKLPVLLIYCKKIL